MVATRALAFLGPFLALKIKKSPEFFPFFGLVKSTKKEWAVPFPLFRCSLKWKRYLEFSSFDSLKFDEGIDFVVTWLIKNSWRKTSLVYLLVLITKWGQHLLNIGFSLSRFNILPYGKVTDPGILLTFCHTRLTTMTKGPPWSHSLRSFQTL